MAEVRSRDRDCTPHTLKLLKYLLNGSSQEWFADYWRISEYKMTSSVTNKPAFIIRSLGGYTPCWVWAKCASRCWQRTLAASVSASEGHEGIRGYEKSSVEFWLRWLTPEETFLPGFLGCPVFLSTEMSPVSSFFCLYLASFIFCKAQCLPSFKPNIL